jgi:serine/threonine protein kinase
MDSVISKKIIKLKPIGGWKGVLVRKWSDLVFDPVELTKNPSQIFKSENGNITSLKEIKWANGNIPFVVKKTASSTLTKRLINFFRTPKSLKNFKIALLLKQNEIEVAEPVAAFWNSHHENIFISEYIPNSMNLYEVAFGKNTEIVKNFSARKAVIRQVAQILAKLHKEGFWHRDSKAGNFIIYKDDTGYKAKLIDFDGIKPNIFSDGEKKIRTLANLAKSLTRFKSVNITDLYRGFMIYCQAMRIHGVHARLLFNKIERATVALRLLMVLEESKNIK